MPEYKVNRKILQVGEALGLTLPKILLEARNLQKGDRVRVEFDSYDFIKIVPEKANDTRQKQPRKMNCGN